MKKKTALSKYDVEIGPVLLTLAYGVDFWQKIGIVHKLFNVDTL